MTKRVKPEWKGMNMAKTTNQQETENIIYMANRIKELEDESADHIKFLNIARHDGYMEAKAEVDKLQAQLKIFKAGKVPRALCPDCRDQCLERATKYLQTQLDAHKTAIAQAIEIMSSEPVQGLGEWETGMFCGLEDVGITDRYEACRYGYDRAIEKVHEWIINGLQNI